MNFTLKMLFNDLIHDQEKRQGEEVVEFSINILDDKGLASVDQVLSRCKEIFQESTREYFWHWQVPEFQLREHLAAKSLQIYGCFHPGDTCYDDEWCMVEVLMRCTEDMPYIAATCVDADGEFMLIETSEEPDFPEWLDPDTGSNRVFIRGGKIHLVAPKADHNSSWTLIDGLKALSFKTEAPKSIQKVIRTRARETLLQAKHKTRILLPQAAIITLHSQTAISSQAVTALYTASVSEDVKFEAQRDGYHFASTMQDLHSVVIPLARTDYAQLLCQPFSPPPISPWHHVLSNVSSSREHDHQQVDLGMKLACGLEILRKINPSLFRQNHHSDNVDEIIREMNHHEPDSTEWLYEDNDENNFTEGTNGPGQVYERFMKESQRILEEIDPEEDDLSSDESDQSRFEDSDEDEFAEREMLEAIKYDPDLLMRIVELCAINSHEEEYQKLFAKLQEIDIVKVREAAQRVKQKGLADLAPEVLAEYQNSSRLEMAIGKADEKAPQDSVEGYDCNYSSSSEEETEIYDDVKGRLRGMSIHSSSEDESETATPRRPNDPDLERRMARGLFRK